MQTWKRDANGNRVLTPEALSAHLRGLVDMRFTIYQAKQVLEPWCIPGELTDAVEQLQLEIDIAQWKTDHPHDNDQTEREASNSHIIY